MSYISEFPIPDGRRIVNDGSRCLCGSYFDENGFCDHGHESRLVYYYRPGEKKPFATSKKAPLMAICEVFSGCRCTICQGLFPDFDDICTNGHEIGQSYPVIAH